MQSTSSDRVGKFHLKTARNGIWYIRWYNKNTGQADCASTRTRDIEAARKALAEFALKNQEFVADRDAQLAGVLQSYYLKYAQNLPSAHAQRAAQADALTIWGDPNVNDLDRDKQLELIEALRARKLSDWTILSRLSRIWAAMNWAKRANQWLEVPVQITAADWKPVLKDRTRVYTLAELAALFNTAAETGRYDRDHWWRFMMLAVGTASREAALRELTWDQVDMSIGRIQLNRAGRLQTKKRRPTVPIAPTLAAELASWKRSGPYVITYYDAPLATREFFDHLADAAGVGGGPNIIRHTVRTWLAEHGVSDSQADTFMGHKGEGSPTGKRYTHRRPEYLDEVVRGVEALYGALSQLLERPFFGAVLEDQPLPDDPNLADHLVGQQSGSSQVAENVGAGNETRTRDPDLGKVP